MLLLGTSKKFFFNFKNVFSKSRKTASVPDPQYGKKEVNK